MLKMGYVLWAIVFPLIRALDNVLVDGTTVAKGKRVFQKEINSCGSFHAFADVSEPFICREQTGPSTLSSIYCVQGMHSPYFVRSSVCVCAEGHLQDRLSPYGRSYVTTEPPGTSAEADNTTRYEQSQCWLQKLENLTACGDSRFSNSTSTLL